VDILAQQRFPGDLKVALICFICFLGCGQAGAVCAYRIKQVLVFQTAPRLSELITGRCNFTSPLHCCTLPIAVNPIRLCAWTLTQNRPCDNNSPKTRKEKERLEFRFVFPMPAAVFLISLTVCNMRTRDHTRLALNNVGHFSQIHHPLVIRTKAPFPNFVFTLAARCCWTPISDETRVGLSKLGIDGWCQLLDK